MTDGDTGGEREHILKTDLREFSYRRGTEGPYADNLDIDVLICGAGFGGVYALHEMRKAGYSTVLYDAGKGYGGTWRWVGRISTVTAMELVTDIPQNVYPGARVDSPVPIYELAIPEVYKDWTWSTNYPDWVELQAYFDHVDKVLDLRKDTSFQTVIVSAEFNKDDGKWHIKTEDGRYTKCKYFIVAAGFAAKRCEYR